MNLRLGLFSGGVPEWPVERFVEAARSAGFEGVEWELRLDGRHIDRRDVAAGARRCASAASSVELPVCAVSAHPSLSVLDEEDVSALVEACRQTDAPIGRMFAPPPHRATPAAAQLDAVSDALRAHAAGFGSHGVTLVIELAQETVIPSPELLRRVCEELDPRAVGGLYDPANMVVEGNLTPWLALELLGPYLHHVHVKNWAFLERDGCWADAITQLDTGLVDWPLIFGELEERDYEGWVVVDHPSAQASDERLGGDRELVHTMWSERSRDREGHVGRATRSTPTPPPGGVLD